MCTNCTKRYGFDLGAGCSANLVESEERLRARVEKLEKGLRAVEAHHANLNAAHRRPESHSKTLKLVRDALAVETPRARDRCGYHNMVLCKNGCCHKCVEASGKKCNHG